MNEETKKITAKSYTLYTENGGWLGQIVLTSDGAFMSVTDYGNFSYAWRSFGPDNFREFLCRLDTQYFGQKMVNGMAYVSYDNKVKKAAARFAEIILPALKEVLNRELEEEKNATPEANRGE